MMKIVAAATVILAAGLVAAEPQHALPPGTKISCTKPNASYCMGGDIILRCGPDALGEPARCSVSDSPPAGDGGVVECWESSRDAGDAACRKNCVVYAENPFTLPADKCTPSSATETGQHPTGSSSAASSSAGGSTSTGYSTAPTLTTSSSSAYISLPSPPPGTPSSNSTIAIPTMTRSTSTTKSTSTSSSGGSTITLTSTAGSKPTTTTPPPNSNDAAAYNAMSGLFVLGLAVAALI